MNATLFRRGLEIFRIEGPRGISSRIKKHIVKCYSSAHLLVFVADSSAIKSAAAQSKGLFKLSLRFTSSLDFKEIFFHDEAEIDELTEIDPWKFPKALTVKQLSQGCMCFVAKRENKIVACICAWPTQSYYDDFLKNEYLLGYSEAYFWRAFCIPSFRGIGILPQIMLYAVETVESKYNKTTQISWVRVTNKAMQQTLTRMGWKAAGRGGFVELFGLRLNYLWGREAFKETKRRFFFQINKELFQ
ncbi:MAG TPA: GNAT family N-acetyltransferase [Terriglobales bacterium]|jgi:hypothetical protein